MKQLLYAAIAIGLTYGVSLLVGNALLRLVRAKLARSESIFLGFLLGAACLGGIVFVLASAGLARKGAFVITGLVLISGAVWRGGHRLSGEHMPPVPKPWLLVFILIYGVFAALYANEVQAPSSEGELSHAMVDVSHLARDFGFAQPSNSPRDGVEMLLLFAFAIGKERAAAMIALLFLLVCPFGMLSFARRAGNPAAGVVGSLLFFASPVAGKSGSSAGMETAVACLLFAVFYLLYLIGRQRQLRLAAPAAIILGFAAWVLIPWLIWGVAHPNLAPVWDANVPLDLTIRGARLHGLLGPMFLLAPLAVLALRWPAGRWLVPAALLLSLPYLTNTRTPSLIPCLPFVSLALALVLSKWRAMAPAVLLAHAILSWPGFVSLYCDAEAWRLVWR